MYFIVCLCLVIVGGLIGSAYPYKGSLTDAASYAGIVSSLITFFSFIIAWSLYSKWKEPLIVNERRSVMEDLSSLSEQHKNCGLFITENMNETSISMNQVIKSRTLIELHHIIVKINLLDTFVDSSIELSKNKEFSQHIFYLEDLVDSMCSMVENDQLKNFEGKEKFLHINEVCMQCYVDFTLLIKGYGLEGH